MKKSNQNKGKRHVGRPSAYNPKYCDEIIDFFDIEPHFETPVTYTYKDGTKKEEIKLIPSDLPTLAGFAVKIGVHRETLNNWASEHKDFFDAIKRAKECQEHILVTNGIQGIYAQAFAIFTAKNIMGWKDRTEFSGDKESPLEHKVSVEIVEDKQKE